MAFDVATFHRAAVETPAHEDVGAMRDLLVETLEANGVEATVDDWGNVVATRGPSADRADWHLVFNTHVDTVPPHVPYDRDGDVVRGRGACDAKGPLAAMVGAFLAADLGVGRLTLAITPDEETTQTGAAHLADRLSADGYVVGEPTDLDVCTAARGQFEGTVTIHGESGHAASPETGANAIAAAEAVLGGMASYDAERGPGEHETLGPPLLTPTMIEGGEATNQIPAECRITFDRRSVPPETSAEFPAALVDHLRAHLPDGLSLSVELIRPDTPFPEAFATEADADLVSALQRAGAGEVRAFGAATEASHFAPDAPTVVFGPGVLADEEGPVAHAEREYVDLGQVRRARDVLVALLEDGVA